MVVPPTPDGSMESMNLLRRVRPGGAEPALDPVDAALTAAGRGDEAAFAGFYDLIAPAVHGTILRVVRDPAMADEVTQEVFVELWRLAPRFDRSRGSARAWSATIAHRRAVDRVRAEQARRNREAREAQRSAVPYDEVSETVGDDLERQRVARALAGLSDTQREAITLAYYGGNTYREVAALLSIAEGTAKTRIRDGLIKLRDTLGVEA